MEEPIKDEDSSSSATCRRQLQPGHNKVSSPFGPKRIKASAVALRDWHTRKEAFRAPKVDWKIKTMITSCEDGKRSELKSYTKLPQTNSVPKALLKNWTSWNFEGQHRKTELYKCILSCLHPNPAAPPLDTAHLLAGTHPAAAHGQHHLSTKCTEAIRLSKCTEANLLQKRKSQLGRTGLALVVGFQLLPKAHLEHTPAPPASQPPCMAIPLSHFSAAKRILVTFKTLNFTAGRVQNTQAFRRSTSAFASQIPQAFLRFGAESSVVLTEWTWQAQRIRSTIHVIQEGSLGL